MKYEVMSGAIRLQQRGASGARRLVAAITGLWLVAFGVLGVRHESRVAHFVDVGTGQVFHASAIVGEHTGHHSDVHPSGSAPDLDPCAVAATRHQSTTPALAPVQLVLLLQAATPPVDRAPRAAVASQLVYRLAPKTSPPVVA